MQKRDLYQNQFSNKKGPLQNLRARKSTLCGPHIPVPTFPLSTPPGLNIGKFLIIFGCPSIARKCGILRVFFSSSSSSSFFSLSFNVYSVIQKPAILECENVLVMFNARVTVIYIGLEVHFFRDKQNIYYS